MESFVQPISALVQYIATEARDLGFDSRIGQIERGVANRSSPLRRFCVA